jgi:DNA helicase-2/ATP-dependent DNA helicase PcrA
VTLRAAIDSLNDEQREAVLHSGDTVVLAGPGSGKTDTVVLKVAYLLSSEIRPPRGVACITFSTDAAREFTIRLRRQGLRPGPRLFLGTVHGFCLTRVIRPYARLAGVPELGERTVLSASRQQRLIQRALDLEDVAENAAYFGTTLSVIRKAMACEESLDPYDRRHLNVAQRYEQLLVGEQLIDFDAMTFEALRLIRNDGAVADLLVARYPWLAVDEYQDLGGVLHKIVGRLREVGARIFAVGDPDQCVYGFNGANPRYLNELELEPGFLPIRLRFNYRSGRRLIDAAEAALDASRGYEPDPERTDEGEVIFNPCPPGLESQARSIVEYLLPGLFDTGVSPHEIAILYRGRGPVLDAVVEELSDAGMPYILERDTAFPGTQLVKWLQRSAIWAIDPTAPDVDGFSDLAVSYLGLVADAGRGGGEGDLADRARLMRALDGGLSPEEDLSSWVRRLDAQLDLGAMLAEDGSRPDDAESLSILSYPPESAEVTTVADFARGAQMRGRVVVTTYHASKARQFDVVILPGLQETIMPGARWNRQLRRNETPELPEDRRLFYVAFTRARYQVILCYSPSFINVNGYVVEGHSRFVDEIAERLAIDP